MSLINQALIVSFCPLLQKSKSSSRTRSKEEGTEVVGSAVYDIIAADDFESLRGLLVKMPEAAHVRSKDGRGPMFWAHEKGRTRIVNALRILGVRENVKDAQGRTPLEGSTVVVEGG